MAEEMPDEEKRKILEGINPPPVDMEGLLQHVIDPNAEERPDIQFELPPPVTEGFDYAGLKSEDPNFERIPYAMRQVEVPLVIWIDGERHVVGRAKAVGAEIHCWLDAPEASEIRQMFDRGIIGDGQSVKFRATDPTGFPDVDVKYYGVRSPEWHKRQEDVFRKFASPQPTETHDQPQEDGGLD